MLTDSNRPKTIPASVTRPDRALIGKLTASFKCGGASITLLDAGDVTLEDLFNLTVGQYELKLILHEILPSTTITTSSMPTDLKPGDLLKVVNTPSKTVMAVHPKSQMGNRKMLNESMKLASWKITAIRSAKTKRHVIRDLVKKFGISSSAIKRLRSAKLEEIWVK